MIWFVLLYILITPLAASACAVLISKSNGSKKVSPSVLISSVLFWPVLIVVYIVMLIVYHVYSAFSRLIKSWVSYLDEKF